jgi:hypothetical protein
MTRETAAAKARRYLAEGRLTVLEVGPSIVRAVCRGDGQVYRSAGGAGSGAAPARLPAPSAPTAPTYSRSAWSSSNPAAPTA